MNLLHLEYFYFVAKENGFTNASKVLRIQQPAISRMVKMLEEDLEVRLFEKVGRSVQLTPRGADVFEHCKKIFGAVDEFKQSLGQISTECKGPLKIACSESIASHFFPNILPDYLLNFTKVYPNIFSGPASILFERILNGEIELGVFFHIPDLPERLEIFEEKQVRHHLVINKEFRRNRNIIETFIGSREIDDTSTRRFPTLERLKLDFPNAKIKISSNNLTAHRGMVLKGLGVSVLPDFLIRNDLREGRVVDIFPKEALKFQMKFIKRRSSILSAAAKQFVHFCSNN